MRYLVPFLVLIFFLNLFFFFSFRKLLQSSFLFIYTTAKLVWVFSHSFIHSLVSTVGFIFILIYFQWALKKKDFIYLFTYLFGA